MDGRTHPPSDSPVPEAAREAARPSTPTGEQLDAFADLLFSSSPPAWVVKALRRMLLRPDGSTRAQRRRRHGAGSNAAARAARDAERTSAKPARRPPKPARAPSKK